MPAHIRDDQSMRAITELKEIKIIPPNNFSWPTERSNFYTRNLRGTLRQKGTLDNLRKFQFRFKATAFFIAVVIQTNCRGVIHRKQLGIYNLMTNLTNAQRIVF